MSKKVSPFCHTYCKVSKEKKIFIYIQIYESFPLVKTGCLTNFEPQISDFDNNESYSVVEYPHMTSFELIAVNSFYMNQSHIYGICSSTIYCEL